MRPIDGDSLVASLEESYKELRKLYDEIKDGDGAKEVYQGELITFLEAILRVKNAPTLDYAPVRHAYWVPWIEDVEIYNTGGFVEQKQIGWKCSGCKDGRVSWKRTHCPDCGARMDGDSNNEL